MEAKCVHAGRQVEQLAVTEDIDFPIDLIVLVPDANDASGSAGVCLRKTGQDPLDGLVMRIGRTSGDEP